MTLYENRYFCVIQHFNLSESLDFVRQAIEKRFSIHDLYASEERKFLVNDAIQKLAYQLTNVKSAYNFMEFNKALSDFLFSIHDIIHNKELLPVVEEIPEVEEVEDIEETRGPIEVGAMVVFGAMAVWVVLRSFGF